MEKFEASSLTQKNLPKKTKPEPMTYKHGTRPRVIRMKKLIESHETSFWELIRGLRKTLNELPPDKSVQAEFRKGLAHEFGKSKQWVSDFCRVATSDPIHAVHPGGQLPASITILRHLASIDTDYFYQCVEDGRIHAQMTRENALLLIEQQQPSQEIVRVLDFGLNALEEASEEVKRLTQAGEMEEAYKLHKKMAALSTEISIFFMETERHLVKSIDALEQQAKEGNQQAIITLAQLTDA